MLALSEPVPNKYGEIEINPNEPPPADPDAKNPLVNPAENPYTIRTRMYDGMGPEVEIVKPQAILNNIQIRIDYPDGVDEHGNPITYQKRKEREIVRKITGRFLKNYSDGVKEGRVKVPENQESQLDYWKRKTEETKAYIKEHGPITTKNFVHPGSDPVQSKRYYLPSTRLTYKDGKFIPIYDEKDPAYQAIKPNEAFLEKERQREELRRQAEANGERRVLVEQTRVLRKVTGIDEAQDAYSRGEAPKKLSMEEVSHYAKVDEDNAQNPTSTSNDPYEIAPEKTEEELLQEQFKDLGTPQSSIVGDLFRFLLGIGDAQANEITSNPHFDKFKSGVLQSNPAELRGDFEDFTEEARKQNEEVASRFREMRKDGEPSKKSDCETCSDDPIRDATKLIEAKREADRKKRNTPKKSLKDFTEASIAVDKLTKEKDLSKYSDTADALLKQLNNPAFEGSIYQSMKKTLEAHPEIRNYIPDIDERMENIRIGQENALKALDPAILKQYEITYIFISYSMGDSTLADIFKRTAGKADTQLVMRGFPEGMTFAQGFKRFKTIVEKEKMKIMPNFTVDPPLFEVYGITQVPAVVRAQGIPESIASVSPKRDYPKLIAKVTGLASDEWLKEQIENGEKGDLGNRGNVFQIAEPDLIEVMKAKVASVDWEKKREEAFNRYWDNRKFDVLPIAEETKEIRIDPSFVVPREIKDLAGNVLYSAGDKVNPLDVRPFTETVLIFNPTRPDELERVDEYLKEHTAAGLKKPIFVATEIDKKRGWDAYTEVSDRFDSHIYFMVPEFKKTWGIKATPSVIWGDNEAKEFAVRELGPLDKEKDEGKKGDK